MASKILYVGDGKWCYTRDCSLHAREIKLVAQYKKAIKSGESHRVAVYVRELLKSDTGVEAYRYLRVQELKKLLGRSPTIALDIDNTTGDFTTAFRAFMGVKYRIRKSEWLNHFPDNPDYDFLGGDKPWFRDRKDLLTHLKEAEQKGLYLTLKPFPGARETLEELAQYGFKIKVVTARNASNSTTTRKWLQEHNIPFSELVALGHHNKAEIEDADIYVDDSPSVVNNLSENRRRAIIMDQIYNLETEIAGRTKMARVDKWGDDVIEAVFELLSHARRDVKTKPSN